MNKLDRNALERQVDDAHKRYSQAVADSTRAQLLLICLETREQETAAHTIEFVPSDQGDFLHLDQVFDKDGNLLDEYFDDDARAWDLDTDRPASTGVWQPVMDMIGTHRHSPRWRLVIDDAVARLTKGDDEEDDLDRCANGCTCPRRIDITVRAEATIEETWRVEPHPDGRWGKELPTHRDALSMLGAPAVFISDRAVSGERDREVIDVNWTEEPMP